MHISHSLGALSNLCIDHHIKKIMGTSHMITLVTQIMEEHRFDSKALTSACGLLTNLAYDGICY